MNNKVYEILVTFGYTDSNTSKYIWLPEMEWIAKEDISYYNNERYSYLNVRNLFIFAINGAGDFFAWDKNDEKVIFCDQGSGYGIVFALNLEGAIFRRIVQFANGDYVDFCSDEEKNKMNSDEAEEYLCETEAIELMKTYRICFKDLFKSEWLEIINGFINNGFSNGDSFIDEQIKIDIINKHLKFRNINMKVDLN